MAAFSGFYESHELPPSSDVCGIVPPHHNGHQNGQQSGHILHSCFDDCRLGGRRGDTEHVVTRWQRPVASGVALLDMLHQAMLHALLQHLHMDMAIKMACVGDTFILLVESK